MKISYQLLRIIACICACFYLIIDVLDVGGNSHGILVLKNLFVSYQPLFFMLSGRFILERYDGKLSKFYLRRFLKIVLPFLVASGIALMSRIGFSVSFGFVKDYIKGICFHTIEPSYSFMYVMFVFYLIAPFLARMVQSLSEKERRQFILLLTGYFVFFDICVIADLRLSIASYPFINMFAYALLGYLIDFISLTGKERKAICVMGVFALFVSSAEVLFMPEVNWAIDSFCLTRVLICMMVYLAVTGIKFLDMNEVSDINTNRNNPKKPSGRKTARMINVAAKSTYYVALFLPILLSVIFKGSR